MPEQANAAAPATAADIMRPPLTTVEQSDHIAAAAYLMKHAGTTALMVLDARTGQPAGIITEADIAHAVADGKDVNSTRIHDLMTARPTVISTTTSVRDAAKVMTSGHFRHLPVVGDARPVINGLTLHWNSGKVEGTVNKIKMIKRQMYGRAGFDLLLLD